MVGGRSSGAGTQLLRFGSKCLYLVGHLADTGLLLLNCVAKQVPKRVLCNAVYLKALDREGRRVREKKKKVHLIGTGNHKNLLAVKNPYDGSESDCKPF